MSWSAAQARSYAREIAKSREGQAWWAFPDEMREALVSHRVLMIVLGQAKEAIEVDAIRDLRKMVCAALRLYHRMPVGDEEA